MDFLIIIGAHEALLELENISIYKDMLNNINRIVNCETANLGKTINAAVRQIESIQYLGIIMVYPSLHRLSERLPNWDENPDASLKELGQIDPPIGKSGVNHRLSWIKWRRAGKKGSQLIGTVRIL